MTAEKGFNRQINQFLVEQPESDASGIIRFIIGKYPNKNNYYSIFDDVTLKLGVEIIAQEVVDSKTDKTVGYLPIIRYKKDNKLNEIPQDIELVNENNPMDLIDCYSYLAKELIYKLMTIPNLKEILKNK